ncbi:hypothetical protein Cgig2_033013 [Carnegiea gigantea]|uniref:Fe2OG dioxygenase domain-containing protein n=1 Tax=Carnegiea gigantea TaxID=171969 RepID=A0A9Q1QDV9_9CARY|nr:hypothetical protein Cgig2_033013 [Carnegiea gigantea]
MEKLASYWSTDKTLPDSYVLPPGERPGDTSVPPCKIPIVDLSKVAGHDRANAIEQIMQAAVKFGFFQVINHGIRKELLKDAMSVFTEFFELPFKDKSHLYSEELNENCRLYTSSYNYAREEIHYWRDCLKHNCRLGSRILDLICEGLGLEPGYFANGLSGEAFLVVNHYPPCPDPSLTLGLPKHCDPNLITLLLQGNVPGLQVFVDGECLLVEPCPDAFVVNIGYQFQVISNGMMRSVEHRVVTNAETARTTAALFIKPSKNAILNLQKLL